MRPKKGRFAHWLEKCTVTPVCLRHFFPTKREGRVTTGWGILRPLRSPYLSARMPTGRTARRQPRRPRPEALPKAATGIEGLDEITGGGLPRGRPTLVSGAAGCGKTILAAEFLVHGALDFDEPGVFMLFEESAEELTQNLRSFGIDLHDLQRRKKIVIDHVHVERSEFEETGEYDLQGLFIRLAHAIDTIGARRVVLDTVEALFAGLPNEAVLRAELRRLFRWLKDRGVTAVVTGERGENALTRFGLEEYVADCVILLDQHVARQVSTRRLRVLKYRGSAHGTNEYPFMISESGVSVVPITSLKLDHDVCSDRVSTGIAELDHMLSGEGFYRGSTILVSGSPGTGKSSISASAVDAGCSRGERAMIFAYEESAAQLTRNMRSIGIDLGRWQRKGLLTIHASRPTGLGLEQHLVAMYELVRKEMPTFVVVDPMTNMAIEDADFSLKLTLMRLIDFFKREKITAMFTSLNAEVSSSVAAADSLVGVSSLMDTWLMLANLESNGERTRTLQIVKSRGMAHSNKVREFVLTHDGIELVDIFMDEDRVLTGTMRQTRQARAAGFEPASAKALARAPRDRGARRTSKSRR